MILLLLPILAFIVWKELQFQEKVVRLIRCGLDVYTPKEELQKALDFENKRAQMLDAVNVQQNRHYCLWLDRGKQMGVIK